MSRKNEEPRGATSVSFRVPDFVGEDGIEYTDIEVIVEMEGGIRDTAKVAEALLRPLKDEEWQELADLPDGFDDGCHTRHGELI